MADDAFHRPANYTDELLEAHEKELERLQAEAASKRELLRFVAQWLDIMDEERELLAITQDPSRLTGRRPPGAMLAEEKMRKRVTILKPKVRLARAPASVFVEPMLTYHLPLFSDSS